MEIRDEGAGHGVTLDAARVWQGMVTGSPRTRDSKAGEIPGDAPDDQAVPIEKSRATGAVPAQAAGSAADTRPGAAGTPVVGGAPAVPGADERKRDTPQRVADRNELQALHARLRQALRSRACARAVFLGGELRQRDQGYYRRHVAEDEAFAGCVRAERKRARQVAGEHAPAAANE